MSKRSYEEAEFLELQDEVKRLKDFLHWTDTEYIPAIKALPKGAHVDVDSLPTFKVPPKDIDFSDSSSSVWYALNKKYKGSGSREYESSWDAKAEVDDAINYIQKNAVKPEATFGTKQSALETLRKIGKSVVLAPSCLGSEVRKQFQRDDCLEKAMLKILAGLAIDQRKKIALAEDPKGKFVEKVDELWRMADGLYVLNRMKEVWDALQAAVEAPAPVIDLTVDSGSERGEERGEERNENADEGDDEDQEEDDCDHDTSASRTEAEDEDDSETVEAEHGQSVAPITNPCPASQCGTNDDPESGNDRYAEEG